MRKADRPPSLNICTFSDVYSIYSIDNVTVAWKSSESQKQGRSSFCALPSKIPFNFPGCHSNPLWTFGAPLFRWAQSSLNFPISETRKIIEPNRSSLNFLTVLKTWSVREMAPYFCTYAMHKKSSQFLDFWGFARIERFWLTLRTGASSG